VGNGTTKFTGVLDGNGNVISNPVINLPTTDYVGLFGYLASPARIRNLGLVASNITGKSYVGGLLGYNNSGTISACYATGPVTGSSYVGGLVGHNSSGRISACYATGAVTGSSSDLGGLVGTNGPGTITASYATGRVTGSSSYSFDVGGLVGGNWYGAISVCYATGAVSGSGSGGLVGNNSGTITASFWDTQTSGQSSSAGGAGKTTAQMKNPATFTAAGWNPVSENDPTGDWLLRQDDYPRLFWQLYTPVPVPSVLGLTPEQAQSLLAALGLFTGNSHYTYNPSLTPGLLYDTYPKMGSIAYAGLTTVHLCLAKPTKYSGGDGTTSNPFQIATPGDWIDLMTTSPDWTWNKNFILTADLDLAGIAITPVAPDTSTNSGFQGTSFTGAFDGQGHVIRNPVIYQLASSYIGIFGHLDAPAQIRNLGIVGGEITGNSSVGALAGSISRGAVTNSYASSSVIGQAAVGGLVGSTDSGTISASYATAAVSGWDYYVGGLVGYNYSGTINASCASGPVSGASGYVGGLVGYHYSGTISACYASGPVSGAWRVGGLLGQITSGTVTHCYATGLVTNASGYAGGLVAYIESGDFNACFWDTQTAGQTLGSGYGSSDISGLTTAQMKTQGTFIAAGWDFVDQNDPLGDWLMPQDDYPRLAATIYPRVPVPDLSGLTPADAQSLLNAAGLALGQSYYVYNLSLAPGLICYTYPQPGTVIYAGLNSVNLFLAKHSKYSGGAVTAADPYRIANPDDWLELTVASADWSKQFVLTADLDLAGLILTPVAPDTGTTPGFQGTPFTGVLDGNGHVIRNAVIYRPSTDYVGLFGYLGTGAQIRNLGLVDGNLTGWSCVGALVGRNYYGTISACYATGPVSGAWYVGGLVGQNPSGTITACYATGPVSGSSNCVGGLVGYNSSGTISASYATGPVTGVSMVGGLVGANYSYGAISASYATGAVTGSSYRGGLVGYNSSGTISACFWDTQTSGRTSSAGGTGKTTAQMKTKSTFTAAGWDFTTPVWTICEGLDYPRLAWQHVTCPFPFAGGAGTPADPFLIATAEQMQAVGAYHEHWGLSFKLIADIDLSAYDGQSGRPAFNIIGNDSTNFSGAFDGNGHAISRFTCTSTGRDHVGIFGDVGGPNLQIKNLTLIEPTVNGGLGRGVAPLVGALYSGAVTACTVLGGAIQTDYNAGGLVGYNGGAISDSSSSARVSSNTYTGGLVGSSQGQISRSYASGIVSGGVNVGGLAGNSSGAIANCYAAGPVSGSNCVGGLLGYNDSGAVSNCYASGPVSGASNVGGLIGYSSGGAVAASFWNTQTSGRGASAGGVGKTTAQMKTRSTFTGAGALWDFLGESANGAADIWTICEGTNYPRFLWQVPPADFLCPDGVGVPELAYLADHWLEVAIPPDWPVLPPPVPGLPPPPPPLAMWSNPADLNQDGQVNLLDWYLLAQYWLK